MPLDASLFTLSFEPVQTSKSDEQFFELTDSVNHAVYRVCKGAEAVQLLDPLTEILLGSTKPVSPKILLVELYSPLLAIEVASTGRASWTWSFEFDSVRFALKRDSVSLVGPERGYTLYVVRSPDPDWPISVYKPAMKKGLPTIQMLDYNIARIDSLRDRRGLELVSVLTIMSFLDLFPTVPSTPPALPERRASNTGDVTALPSTGSEATLAKLSIATTKVPPEAKLIGNELLIPEGSLPSSYLTLILSTLSQESHVYLVLRADSEGGVANVIKVAAEVKRQYYKKTGVELRQYIVPSADETSSSGRVVEPKFTPPSTIQLYLSRISLDELIPTRKRVTPKYRPAPPIQLNAPASTKVVVTGETKPKPKPTSSKASSHTPVLDDSAAKFAAKKQGWSLFSRE